MNQVQKDILKQFAPEIQSHIIQFCKELSAIKCDVFILFARKAACFISILEEAGLLKLNGIVVSERVLDYNSDWLKDRQVVLIDDTIISGTAIYKVLRSLNEIGVKDINVRVFCINDFWFVEELLERPDGRTYLNKPYLRLDHTTSLKFCKDIVRAFSIFPRPYSTDFPIFETIRLTVHEFNSIQTLDNWKIVDTTSNLQLEHEIRCFSMNPKKEIFSRFFESLGINLKDYCYLKLRFYSQKFNFKEQRSYYYCRVLPLFIFEPVSDGFLNQLVSAVCETENADVSRINKMLKTSIAKLRFVQFYFAQRFFEFCLSAFEEKLNKSLKYVRNAREQELIFPPELVAIVKKFHFSGTLSLQDIGLDRKFLPQPEKKTQLSNPINPLSVKDILLFKFLDIYHKKELGARRKVKLFKKGAFEKPEFKIDIDRLEQGYTFGQLKAFISDKVTMVADQNLLLSNFLDNAIDSGIIVPVTLYEDGYTSRGYRHGEEIIWGENNDKLMAIFYEKFMSKTETGDFAKFWFEKLLVLFLKMGLKGGALEEYNYLTPPPQATSLLGVRSYLYGQVTVHYELKPAHETKFNPILDYETKGHWASQRLMDINVLTTNESDRYEFDFKHLYDLHAQNGQEMQEPSDLDDDLTGIVEEIAELLAIARNHKELDAKGLVLLTSCISIHDCISSIAAEIYIFHQQIEQIISSMKSAEVKSTLYNVEFLMNLRSSSKNYSWTAINSGTDKYLDFMNGEGETLVKKISRFFGSIDSFKKRSWDKYWKKEIESDISDAPDLHALNNDIGTTLIEINITLIYLQSLVHRKLFLNNLMPLYLQGREDEHSQLTGESNRYAMEIKELSDRAILGNQSEIDFNNAKKRNELEERLKEIKLKALNVRHEVTYWNNYTDDNLQRVHSYIKHYEAIKSPPQEILHLVSKLKGVNSLFDEKALRDQITENLKQLAEYKEKANFLLVNFSSLVPQWGKINPIVKYDGLIHINTESKDAATRLKLGQLVRREIAEFELKEFQSEAELAKSFVLLRPLMHVENSGYYIGMRGPSKLDRFTRLSAKLLFECRKLNIDFHIYYFPQLEDQHMLKAYYNKHSKFFDEIHEEFQEHFTEYESRAAQYKRSLIIFPNHHQNNPDIFKRSAEASINLPIVVNSFNYKRTAGKVDEFFQLEIIEPKAVPKTEKPTKPVEKYIGIVTAIPKEFAAVKVVLSNVVKDFKAPDGDPNDYARAIVISRNGEKINVIIAMAKEMGNAAAANAATNMIRSFPAIQDVIMTGIAGGIPNPEDPENHVRLGDIVVSYRFGVLQYDNIKESSDKITIRSYSAKPSATLVGLCNILESERYTHLTPWNDHIKKHEKAMLYSERPAASKDILRINKMEVAHPNDTERVANLPKIHFGPIGSANTLLKNEKKRDYLRDHYKVKAIEMESSGIADGTWTLAKGYMIVRGICDYCNEDKNNDWQEYAAICAAAYTRCLIELL